MSRLHHVPCLALLAIAGACAPARQPGALSPINARVTNEVVRDDASTLDGWSRRVDALQQTIGTSSGPRAYVAARAAAWLAYARDAYAWDPRDGVADQALDETRRLVLGLEADSLPEPRALPVTTDARARPDLVAVLERARAGSGVQDSPAALAGAEVALVRAAHLAGGPSATRPMTDAERVCEMDRQVAVAEQLLTNYITPALPAPVAVVALQGEPVPPMPRPAPAPKPPVRRGVERVVHFAVGSSQLALSSRVTLGEVIAMLRTHPGVNLVIEGYTDLRGNAEANRELAVRRADAVRRFLDRAQLQMGRVTITGIGTDSAAAGHLSADLFARDRRVTLAFTDSTGAPLSPKAYQLYDIDHARDLQVEGGRRPASRAAHPARRPLVSRSTPR